MQISGQYTSVLIAGVLAMTALNFSLHKLSCNPLLAFQVDDVL